MCWRQVLAVTWVLALGAAVSPGHAEGATPAATAAKRAAAKPAAAPTAAARAVADGWPDTREGELGFRWVEAFVRGDEAMRAFYLETMSEKSLAEKNVESRLVRYRELRERLGRLTFAATVKSAPGELTVRLLDADAASHSFVFKAETTAPFHLISIGMLQQQPGGHGGGHGGGHH